jgi:hypothetical protein
MYAFLTPALGAKFAWRHSAAIIHGTPGGYAALAFASAVAVVAFTAWACSLTGRIRAHKAYAIAMLCFFLLLEISLMTR